MHNLNEYWFLWAKWGKAGDVPVGFHPLPCHMVDVALVAQCMWRDCLPTQWRTQIAASMELNLEKTEQWIMFLAGLHDVGKASPGFQTQLRDPAAAGCVRKLLERAHMPTNQQTWVPHAFVSAIALKEYFERTQKPALDDMRITMMVLGGHHGFFPTAQVLHAQPYPRAAVGNGPWRAARIHLIDWLADIVGLSPDAALPHIPQATALNLAGVITVADWIASDEGNFPFAVPDVANLVPVDETSYVAEARIRAHDALAKLGWSGWHAPAEHTTFTAMFPERTPRPLQDAAISLAPTLPDAAIILIEAPMGEGKTEAALTIADHWSVTSDGRGIYFALPTQATSESMFTRIRDYLRQRYPQDRVTINLLHGHAALSAALQELRDNNRWLLQPHNIFADETSTETETGAVIATEWFAKGKRALLAPFGVGTIDQALLMALAVKHGFVRHFALATKTVIIDEVHAYDVYMTTLLKRLLAWLGAHGVPVVLLSATLPVVRRAQLLAAYGDGAGWSPAALPEPQKAYPRLSWLTAQGARQQHIPIRAQKTVQCMVLDRAATDDEDGRMLGPLVQKALRQGGCIAVICNTVQRAQQIFRALRSHFDDQPGNSKPQLALLHARFPHDMRAQREKRVLQSFGPHGTRPAAAILVATQIIEQSLDLDFDLLVTDLAPVDLVLQRMGRLHRHERATTDPRPTPLNKPQVQIFFPPQHHDVPDFNRADCTVYNAHILMRTWLAMRDREQIIIPDDIEVLVEAVYDENPCLDTLTPAQRTAWYTTQDAMLKARDDEKKEAENRYILPPGADALLDEIMHHRLDEDNPTLHPSLRALTRLASPSVTIICLWGTLLQARAGRDEEPLDLTRPPDVANIEKLLQRSVTLTRHAVVKHFAQVTHPAWQKVALLRQCHPVFFDDDGVAQVGSQRLRLDDDLGIVYE